MKKIFINGLNSKVAGGKSILENYLKMLLSHVSDHKFYVLTPNLKEYKIFNNDFIEILTIPNIYKKTYVYPYTYSRVLPRYLKRHKIDLVFNLSDIPIKTEVKQVFLFDWSYAVYPESIVWSKMDFKSKLIRKTKLYLFRKFLKYINVTIAQTETMMERLLKLYNIENIEVVPNAVSLDNLKFINTKKFELPEGIKLLYLTHYYPHKNLEIFLPLAREIKKRNLAFKLIVTINPSQHKNAQRFLADVKRLNIDDIIYNIGPVEMENVPSLYKQCDGLLMPTLLESFSGTYVESMFHSLPILTSNFDFAYGICKDSAVYFDPFDVNSILDKLQLVFNNHHLRSELISNGKKILDDLPNWVKTFEMYNKIIYKTLQKI